MLFFPFFFLLFAAFSGSFQFLREVCKYDRRVKYAIALGSKYVSIDGTFENEEPATKKIQIFATESTHTCQLEQQYLFLNQKAMI